MAESAVLRIRDVSKQFPGVKALSHVSMEVKKGEIRALMGENGAGKSTLIKILTGIYQFEEGEIEFDGKQVHPKSAIEMQKMGVSTIYQEINLIPYLSVAENIYIGKEPTKNGKIDWEKVKKKAQDALQDLGISLDVTQKINQLSTALQQMVAIARALQTDAKLFIMDEATSSLDKREVERLFDVIRNLKERGIAVIFVSHRMDELFQICDSVTVLKDGELVGTYDMSEMNHHMLVSKMIGRDAAEIIGQRKQYRTDWEQKPVMCEVKDIRKKTKLNGVNLKIREGEIVGLAGLLGSGRTELAKIIFGEDTAYDGDVLIDGEKVHSPNVKKSIEKGVVYCPEDRKTEGVFLGMSVEDNLTISILQSLLRAGFVKKKKKKEIVEEYIKRINIKTPTRGTVVRSLSGGNQQKVILARWLAGKPRLIILDEPTRGIDVGAKSEIEKLIQQLAGEGISVLYISSEIEELVRGCDRIAVLREGTVFGELSGQDITSENLLHMIAGENIIEAGGEL